MSGTISAIAAGLSKTSTARGRPKYRILHDALLAEIAGGRWSPGEKLPTEAEFAEELPFSLGTIQKAISSLVDEGIVVRRRGAGTFVAPRQEMPEPLHARFVDDDGLILPIYPRVDAILQVDPAPLEAAFGRQRTIYRIDRTLSVGGEFSVRNRFYVPEDTARFLLGKPRQELDSANFKLLLTREGEIRIAEIRHFLRHGVGTLMSPLDPALAKFPVFIVEAHACAPNGSTVYVLEMLVPRTTRRLAYTSSL